MLLKRWLVACLIATLMGGGVISPALYAADFSAPVVRMAFTDSSAKAGEALRVSATVSDDQVVSRVILRYRPMKSAAEFSSLPMTKNLASGLYSATIPATQIKAPGVEFFVEASDAVGNVSQEPFPNHPQQVAVKGGGGTFAGGNAKWLWVLAGAVVVGALAGGGGGGDSVGASSTDGPVLSITAAAP